MTTLVRRMTGLALVFGFVFSFGAANTFAANDQLPVSVPETFSVDPGAPVAITGSFAGIVDGHLAIQETNGAGLVAFPLDNSLTVTRGGATVLPNALEPGDAVRMRIDGATGQVLQLEADPVAGPWFAPSNELALVAMLGLVGAAALLVVRNRQPRLVTAEPTGRRLSIESARSMMPRWEAPARPIRVEARG